MVDDAVTWKHLCSAGGGEAEQVDRVRAEYIVHRLTRLDVLPGGTYEPAMISYLALYLADVRREPR